jgi:hypothetical protein
MRGVIPLLLVAMILVIGGCQISPVARREIALLKAEIVDLEDQYYRLKSEFRTATGREPETHQSYRQAGRTLGSSGDLYDDVIIEEGAVIEDSTGFSSDPQWNSPRVNNGQSPNSSQPSSRSIIQQRQPENQNDNEQPERSFEEIDLDPQSVPHDQPRTPSAEQWQRRNRQSQLQRNRTPATGSISTVSFDQFVDQQANHSQSSQELQSLNIASNLTAGYDRDGLVGDDGLYLFLQPLDATGQAIPAHGSIWVSLVDPQNQGDQQRVGLWKISAQEVSDAFRSFGEVKPGVDFYLPWQEQLPQHEQLRLHVRWIAENGQFIESQMDVRVKLRGQSAGSTEQEKSDVAGEVSGDLWRPGR